MNLKISCRKKKSSSSSSVVVELLRGKRRGPNDKRRRVSLAPNGASPYVPPSLLIRAPPSSPYTQAPPIPRLALLLTLSLPMCFLPCQRRRDLTHTHTRIYVDMALVISRTLYTGPASLAPGPPPILSSCRESPGPVNNYRVPHTIPPLYRL
jgi:hypothetical protein